MTQLALVLHFYQPPTQSLNLTEEILRSCYLPLCDLLLAKENARVSLDFSGSLLLQIQRIPGHELSLKIRQLSETGRVDFLNSPIYHPISPLTPTDVLERQLLENKKVLEAFSGIKKFVGIFPPELAIDQKTYDLFKKLDHFVLVNELNNLELTELIRSYPLELSAQKFAKFAEKFPSPIICGSDAEVFGHHYSERINFLRDLFQENFDFVKLSEISIKMPSSVQAGSWQTTSKDTNPYPFWDSTPLQKKYYQLAEMGYQALSETKTDSLPTHVFHSAEVHYDQGISSCHPYWLSNMPWWHPDMVEKGAQQLIKCIRTLPIENDRKQQAEKFYHDFLMSMWHHQWSGKVEKKYQDFDQTRSKFLKSLPSL